MSGFGTFIVACYTALGLAMVCVLLYLVRNWRWKWLIATPLLLGVVALAVAPFAEEAWIASRFEELCRNSGVHVQREVEADGYFDELAGDHT